MYMKEKFKEFFENIVCNKKYYIPLLLFSFVAYAFSIFNRTVSIDDLSYMMFGGDKHMSIAGYRCGLYLLNIFLYTSEYTPFIGRFFAYLLLLVNCVLLSFVFYLVDKENKNVWRYTFLSVMFSTYPLINELWYCTGLSVPIQYNGVTFYFLFVFAACIYLVNVQKISLKDTLIAGIILTPAMAGYESVVFAYVSLVFMVLFINNLHRGDKKYNWFMDGLKFALPLFVALILRFAIGKLLIIVLQVNATAGAGNASIKWFSQDLSDSIIEILYNGWYYVIRALSYMPITEFLIGLLFFIFICFKEKFGNKTKGSVLLGVFLVISLFFLSFVQGEYLHYRTAQTVQLFVAFVAYLFIRCTESIDKFCVKTVSVCLLLFVSLRQSVYLHELLALNNQRSDNEAFIAQTIGYRLYSEFDISKTVIFCGEYQLGSFIEDQISVKKGSLADKVESSVRKLLGHELEREYDEFVCTNINSFFNTQMDAFNGQVMIQKYLSYYGFDINVLSDLSDEEEDKLKGYYELIAKEENMKPFDIKDMGDYILVYLGPTIDGYTKLEYK